MLQLIQLAGIVLLCVGVGRIGLSNDWVHGVPVIVLAGYLMMKPADLADHFDRFLPGGRTASDDGGAGGT